MTGLGELRLARQLQCYEFQAIDRRLTEAQARFKISSSAVRVSTR
jgi:hypothetical protein